MEAEQAVDAQEVTAGLVAQITLKSGRGAGTGPQAVKCAPVTVFVGPNNSGKSLVLAEIQQFAQNGREDGNAKILKALEFRALDARAAKRAIAGFQHKPNHGEAIAQGNIIVGRRGVRHNLAEAGLLEALTNPAKNLKAFCVWYLQSHTLKLDGPGRVGLTNDQAGGDLQKEPSSTFQVLFRDNMIREEIRRIVAAAFGEYLVVDPTNLGQLRLRLSPRTQLTVMKSKACTMLRGSFTPVRGQSKSIATA